MEYQKLIWYPWHSLCEWLPIDYARLLAKGKSSRLIFSPTADCRWGVGNGQNLPLSFSVPQATRQLGTTNRGMDHGQSGRELAPKDRAGS